MEHPQEQELNAGSRWHRWEPHIHAPGTILNDQFEGGDRWEDYLKKLETATPAIRAIGLTDYYSTDTYEKVCEAKRDGRLSGCDLIFPNIEMRLGIGTLKGRWVNIHLLVNPDCTDHLVELKRFLARLTFKAHEDCYSCNREDLIRLGQRSDPKITHPAIALERGSEQFKVSLDALKQFYKESAWAQHNVLIAVAGNGTDGTSGVSDGADATLRQEIEKFAHVIFASSPAQREFWLGRKNVSEDELRTRYGGLKPCMHGSDAHAGRTVGVPDGDRYSWIKGSIDFDALQQACIDPGGRAFVGSAPPVSAAQSQIISTIEVMGAPWATTPKLALNPGLVAIIGARGSGKTALADMIALGCDAVSESLNENSFLRRAGELLNGAAVSLQWEAGDRCKRRLDGSAESSAAEYPRARYLSQQFVEELCSAHGMTDGLMREIERVVFEAQPQTDRDGAMDFNELLELLARRFRDARERDENALAEISERIGTELEKQTLVGSLRKQIEEKAKQIEGYTKDRAKLVPKGDETRVARLNTLTAAADKVRGYIRFYKTQEQSLLGFEDEVTRFRNHQAPEILRQTQERNKSSRLASDDWERFLLKYQGDVDGSLAKHLEDARNALKRWKGKPPTQSADPKVALIAEGAELDDLPLALLEAEIARLEKVVSADRETASKYSALSKRITEESGALARLREKLVDCEGAKERAKTLVKEREAAYARVFDAIQAEQGVLSTLYSPLMTKSLSR